eukprot:g23443.t1
MTGWDHPLVVVGFLLAAYGHPNTLARTPSCGGRINRSCLDQDLPAKDFKEVSLRASLQMPSDPLVNGSVQGTGTMTEFVMGGFLPITNDGTGAWSIFALLLLSIDLFLSHLFKRAMVLPPELNIYAENILRRFPEEFMALGAPNLEENPAIFRFDIYDLRPNGTWSRKMVESSAEKTIEITMRRWSGGNAFVPGYPMGPMAIPQPLAPPQALRPPLSSSMVASIKQVSVCNSSVFATLERKFTPENFDWRALHPTEKNTLLMEGVACGLAGPNEAYLDIIEWLVRSGADAAQRTPPSSQGVWLGEGGSGELSYLLAWKRELQDKAEWSENLAYLDKALARITTATQHIRPVREKVAIDQSVVELWERVLDATASHNLTFETADGPPNHETVLIALDLAHRWQVYGVVNIFAELLQEMITDANFAAIAEAAVLKDLEGVKKVCRIHGMESRAVQDRCVKGLLPKMLQDLLGHKASPAASCPKKRRRF